MPKAAKTTTAVRNVKIAVIGASEKPTVGRRMVASLDRIGFTGRIYPVNPGYPTVLGHTCYANMAELPEAPDVAVFCLGNARVLGAFVAAAERGIKVSIGCLWNRLKYLKLPLKKSRSEPPSRIGRMWPQPAMNGACARPS